MQPATTRARLSPAAIPVLLAALAAALPASASAATPKPKPAKLTVTAISSPPKGLKAGDRFTVSGKVRNGGGTSSPANLAFELRAGANPKVVSALGGDTIAKVKPGRTRSFKARVTVGRTVRVKGRDATSFLLAACVRPRRGATAAACHKASGRSLVAAPPVVTPASPAPPAPPTPPAGPPPAAPPAGPTPGPPDDGPAPNFTVGTRSLGDSLFPTIGNGGYDALHYALDLGYTISSKFLRGTATIDAIATQDLSEYSFDLTYWNGVSQVLVDGEPAAFSRDYDDAKLIVTPPAGIRNGTRFTTTVTYAGVQQAYIDPDGSSEGFVPDPERGAIVLSEPVGAMGWYPNNNVPSDKATYSMRMTVPEDWSALATGVLKARTIADDGATTFVWDEPKPTASYLYSLAIGKYDLSSPDPAAPQLTVPTSPLNTPTPFYTAVDSSFTTGKANMLLTLSRVPSMMDFFADLYDQPYPFDSAGGIVPRQSVHYALETQGKPIYAGTGADLETYAGPSAGTVAHETAHHWFGNSATLEQWKDIWLNEGMTEFSSWLWQAEANSGTTLAARYTTNYTNQNSAAYWSLAPANPPTAVDIFAGQMYSRGAMTMLGVRAILGDTTFRSTMRRYLAENLYGTVTTEEFIALVKDVDPTRAARWTEYFRQWLYGTVKPTMTKDNFDTFVLP